MTSATIELTDKEFEMLRKLVYDRTGIHLPDTKRLLLANRLRRRLRVHKLNNFAEYHELLNKSGSGMQEETDEFLSQITTNETYFFRNEKLWNTFSTKILDPLVEQKAKCKTINVWSAASSSGEEAYSVAITLLEASIKLPGWKFSIVGTDISPRILNRAREGVYGEYAVSRVSPELLRKYFKKVDDEHDRIVDRARDLVRFKFHNLRDPLRDAPMDFVLLRNVMMYFDDAMKERVLRNVIKAMGPKAILFSGDVDPIRSSMKLEKFPEIESIGPFLYRRR